MPARLLATAIQTVAPAASRDQARPVLCGIYVTADDKQVTFTATDSYRLHHLTIPTSASVVVSGAPGKANIPQWWLTRWAKGRSTHMPLPTLSATTKRAMIKYVDGIDACPTIGGPDYPKFDSILDTETPDEGGALLNPRFLAQSLAACARWANGRPVTVEALNWEKPARFKVDTQDGTLQVVQTPARMP